MAHTLTFAITGTGFTVKVNGVDVGTPYQLTSGDVITLVGGSHVWDSGGPKGDYYTGWTVSANGSSIFNDENKTFSEDISIVATSTYENETSPQTFNATINYTETSRKSVDLTTLTGWEALSSGTHNITVVAKADGYRDSEPSEAVSVEKAASGETWLLNETISIPSPTTYSINFVSDNINFTEFQFYDVRGEKGLNYNNDTGTSVTAALESGWFNEAYRTITFETAPTGDLLTWLQANGTKQ